MSRHVHSSDPRKPAIKAALCALAGGTKVTMLRENADGSFTGCGLRGGGAGRTFFNMGEFTVRLDEPPVPS